MPLGSAPTDEMSCLDCRGWPEELAWARFAYVLRPPADAIVHALKYGGWDRLGHLMGSRMAALEVLAHCPDTTCVVPVPTTRKRERRRGYNQARLLALAAAQNRDLEVVEALDRPGAGVTQVALHPTQRRANVENAFRLRAEVGGSVRGCRVVLIDDVLTTGATAGAAARVLHRAGAVEIGLVTFARALPFKEIEP